MKKNGFDIFMLLFCFIMMSNYSNAQLNGKKSVSKDFTPKAIRSSVRIIESNSGKEVAVKLDHINGECIVFHTKPGVTYLIQKKNLI